MGTRHRRGFTLVEIMIVVAIIALLAAIAIPNVLRGRTSANEAAVIGNMRAVNSALQMFQSVNNVFPTTWNTEMYGADCAAATAPNPDYGPPSFCVNLDGGAAVQGYTYTYADGAAPVNSYTVLAVPQTLGTTGTRSFYTDQSGVLRHCTGTGTVANIADESTVDTAPTACD
ncbi:MAG: prepilin-type N-terminal cleavage/methylation domain-containing protein [Candidatus Omnitrophica bacterium]|nr:prepilin-type N-terminal cleavage/methylation domain-containing protein [Candidatus Omnitrophota bacterium]